MKKIGTKGKESPKNSRKNYRAMKRNPFRFLALKRVMVPIGIVTFLGMVGIGNFLLYTMRYVLPNVIHYLRAGQQYNFPVLKAIFYFSFKEAPVYYLIVLFIAGWFTFKVMLKLYTSFNPLEEDFTQGAMEWANHEDLIKEYEEVPVHVFAEDEDYFDGTPGLPISRAPRTKEEEKTGNFRYLVDTFVGNSMILASTRIGKSRYFINGFIDIISRAKDQQKRWSFIMTATKGTEPLEWYQPLKKRGYNIRVYNTVNQYNSDPFPVLKIFFKFYQHYCEFKGKAQLQATEKEQAKYKIKAEQQLAHAENALRRSAQSFFVEVNEGRDGGFWTKACRNLFMSLALALADQAIRENEPTKVNPYTIYDTANEMITQKIDEQNMDFLKPFAKNKSELKKLVAKYKGSSHLDVYFQELPRTHPARKYYSAILACAPAKTTLGNVLTHFDGDLESFLQSANAKMTSWDDGFDIESIGFDKERPTAVFIIMSDSDELNNRLGLLILDQLYQVLKNKADLMEENGEAHCFRPVITIGDESGNLGFPIQNLERKWTAGLSRWLYFMIVLQDISQLSTLYSDSVQKTILGNLANLIYIRSGSKDTNEYISSVLGNRVIYNRSRTKDPTSISSTEQENIDRTLGLLQSFELSRLRDGESVVIRLNHGEDKEGNVIYQYPIFNTFENDTNMIKFDEMRKMEMLSWEEIPLNNEFMYMDTEDLLWTLYPFKEQPVNKESKQKPSDLERKASLQTPIFEEEDSFVQQQTLFDTLPLYNQTVENKGGESMPTIMDFTQASEEREALEAMESEEKKKQLAVYTSKYQEVLHAPCSEVFSKMRQIELKKIIEQKFEKTPVVLNEYRRIVEIQNQELLSFFVFLVSNGDESLHKKIESLLEKWEGVAS